VKNQRLIYAFSGGAALLFLALIVYHNAFWGGFVSDDGFQILENPWIKDPSFLPGIFSHSLSGFSAQRFQQATYRPMMYTAFTVEYALFGLNPPGWHVVNVLLHSANGVLVFLIFTRLLAVFSLERPGKAFSAWPAAMTAGALFVSHPSASEAVSWVSALPELAFTFLVLLALYIHLRPVHGHKETAPQRTTPASYVPGPALFFIALLFKETAIVLPVLILIFDVLTKKAVKKRVVTLYAAYGAAFAVYMVLRVHALGALTPSSNINAFLGRGGLVLNAFSGFYKALVLLFVPVRGYPFQVFDALSSPLEARALVSVFSAAAFIVTLYVLIKKRAHPIVLLSVAVMVLPVLPALYTPVITRFDFAPRYVYLPTAGYGVLLAFIIRWLFRRGPLGGRVNLGLLVMALPWVFIISCSFSSMARTRYWHDNLSLARAGLLGSNDNYYAHYQIGNAEQKRAQYPDAAHHYRQAIGLIDAREHRDAQTLRDALLGLGGAALAMGRAEEALLAYGRVIELVPDNAAANYQMGYIYQGLGKCERALLYYSTAERLFRRSADRRDTLLNMGNCLARLGRYKEAQGAYTSALALAPGDPQVRRNLATLRRMMTAPDRRE